MFSLIIALVAIALVAVLAGASVYYGTSAWSNNQSKAKYAEIVNQSEQISNAFLAFKINGNELDDTTCNTGDTTGCMQQLIDSQYLSSVPVRTEKIINQDDWSIDETGALYTTTQDVDACIMANEKKGYDISLFPTHDNGDGVPSEAQKVAAVDAGAVCVSTT
jgi:type II secretory pathway pseudopilin PulG